MKMQLVKDGGEMIEESPSDYHRFFANPKFIHYVGMLMPPRPGFEDCIKMLEFTHYVPNTERNHLFVMRVLDWADILWGIISIPFEEKHFMERMAQVNGLRIADGIPTMFAEGGVHPFPIMSRNLFTLENLPNHPVYQAGLR